MRQGIRLALISVLLTCSVALAQTNEVKTRPANWASPLNEPGLSNFYKVTTNLYRGAQPSAQGMKELKSMGVKTVLNLRSFHSDQHLVSSGDMKLARLHMKPWHAEDEDVVAFLKIASNTNNLPLFVHCQRGADRTGMICAMYRVVICGWTKEDAIKEMKEGGFHFNPGWENLVDYVNKADVEGLKKRAGIVERASRP
jgi:protein tyrosine/serine phosphatase